MNLLKSSLTLLALAFAVNASASTPPTKVAATFDKVYVADGFDSNDIVQVVGEGLFSSVCYRHTQTEVSVNHAKKEIWLGPVAYQYNGFCLQIVLPFDRVVEVGILEPGTYAVMQSFDNRKLGEIKVDQAKSSTPDDFLYAPISQAFIRNRGLVNEITLTGEFPTSCMKLAEVRVKAQSDVVVVQPIAEVDTSVACKEGKFPFEKKVDISHLKQGRYLLHVRSMNGRAVNTLFDVQ